MPDVDELAQRVIVSLDEGWGRKTLRLFVFACLVLGVFAFYAASRYRGLTDPEAMEQAQLARNLAEGRGFCTESIRPFDIAFLTRKTGVAPLAYRFPDLRHGPVYPFLLAAGFKLGHPSFQVGGPGALFAPETRVIVPLGLLLTLAAGVFLFLAGRRLFDSRVGFVALVTFLVTDAVLKDAIGGTPAPALACFGAAAVYAAVVARQARRRGRRAIVWLPALISSAALCGVAGLTGYTALALAPLLACFATGGVDRGRTALALLFMLVCAAVVVPWLLRNERVCGTPFGTAPYEAFHQTFLYPEDAVDRATDATFPHSLAVRALKAKLTANLFTLAEGRLRQLGSGLAVCFFLASFFHVFGREEAGVFRWWLLAWLAAATVAAGLGAGTAARGFSMVLPFVVLYGVAFCVDVVDRIHIEDQWKDAFMGVFVALAAAPAALNAWALPPAAPYPPYYPPFISYSCGLLRADEVTCSDVPWAVAWYGRRSSVLLPRTTEEFTALHHDWREFSGLYLTTETGDRPYYSGLVEGPFRPWRPLLDGTAPEGFPLQHGFTLPPRGPASQIFLTDRVRWKDEAPRDLAEDVSDEFEVRESP